MTRWILSILTVLAVLMLAACGGDDEGDKSASTSASPSASASASQSPRASPANTGSVADNGTPAPVQGTPSTTAAPPPAEPPLGPGVTKIGSGTMTFVIAPNGSFPVDGYALVQGAEPPPCAAFVFAFRWEITNPSPPGDASIAWEITRQDIRQEVASGAQGTATVGCGMLTAVNRSQTTLTVSVHYVQGRMAG